MSFPTLQEVEQATRLQLARWYRFLPLARNEAELEVINRVYKRFVAAGGFTPELSKAVGW